MSDETRFARKDDCLVHELVPLTYEARNYFSAFIDKLHKQSCKLIAVMCTMCE